MKRLPPTSIPEWSAPARRKRVLSEEEHALWENLAKQIRPLRKQPGASRPQAAATETPVTPKPASPPKQLPSPVRPPPKPPMALAAPPLAPLGRRERSHLSRGRKDIDARLDLHGMTQSRAHRALLGFLQRARRDGLTFVLVITGKGRVTGVESERGVLRRLVPQWLELPEFRALVVGFEQAHVAHGGEGALYLRVRRARI